MKRFIQWVCIILILATFFSTTAFAVETNARASDFFLSHRIYLWEVSSTKFEVWFEVTAVERMDKLGVSYIEVQQSSDKTNWDPVATYYMSDYSQMTAKGAIHHSDCVPYTYTSGYYYRAFVTLYAENENGTAEYFDYTPIMDLR